LADIANHEGFDVRVRSLPLRRVAFIRVCDPFSSFDSVRDAYYRLVDWYHERGGDIEDTTLFGIFQDDPEITPLHLYRFDWCLSVPSDWKPEGEVGVKNFPACRVATIHCVGDIERESRAVQYLFRYWLARSRYQPANLPAMEIYRQQPAVLGWETFDIECALPVIPL